MSNMPASPFLSSAVVERPAETSAVASYSPQVPDAATDSVEYVDLDAIDCIPQIFVGARKLGSHAPGIFDFDPAAIPPADLLLYDVLKAMVDPNQRDLPYILDEEALYEAIDPKPLFLQAAGY